jgi:amidohydrolase
MIDNIAGLARSQQDYIVGIRRKLHEHPEISFQEKGTSSLVQEELEKNNIPYVITGDYGVVATIKGQNKGHVVALRADMDALAIHEQNGQLPYQSRNDGVMHACGHDGHVAMLLGAAKIFKQIQSQLRGSVALCFQQAEEQGGGTTEILKVLSQLPVKNAFAIHLWSEIETGKFSVESGPRMAACDNFQITVEGVGCHGASPHLGIDPIVVASAIVMNVSNMLTREIDPTHPTVLTFGKLQSGHAANAIPDSAILAGTIRTTRTADQLHLHAALRRIVTNTAEGYRATAVVDIKRGGSILINDAKASILAADAVRKISSAGDLISLSPLMVSENFGDFLDIYPGLMAFLGVRNDACGACYPHHHPKFNIDEEPLYLGAALHVQYALNCFLAADSSSS